MTRLEQRRKAMGLTVLQLADRAGVHPNSIHYWERQGRAPRMSKALSVAQALDCSPSDIFDVISSDRFNAEPIPIVRSMQKYPPKPCTVAGCDRMTAGGTRHGAMCDAHKTIWKQWPLPWTPPTQDPRWRDKAACAGMDTEAFYPTARKGLPTLPSPAVFDACQSCPVRGDCLDDALQLGSYADSGLWGGTGPRDRDQMRRNLKRRGAEAA